MRGLAVRVDALLTGLTMPYTRPGSASAIDKRVRTGAVYIGELGLSGDAHGDSRVHGGPDKAVHLYAFDHYPMWRAELGGLWALQSPGAFGENISTCGLTEHDVCLGDRITLGRSVLEVSQGRQPCWKLNDRAWCRARWRTGPDESMGRPGRETWLQPRPVRTDEPRSTHANAND